MAQGRTEIDVIGSDGVSPVSASNPLAVAAAAGTTAAAAGTPAKVFAAATTNATLLKNAAGVLHSFHLSNTSAALKYVKFFNKATAPVPGTDTPLFTVVLEPNSSRNFSPPSGIGFATGLGYSITGALADNDATAVAAGDVVGVIAFK